MELIIRYLGIVQVRREIQPGEYVIGRGPGCDFELTQDFISRRHGKIFFKDGAWYYQDLRTGHPRFKKEPRPFDDTRMVELENDIDILTANFLRNETTARYDIRDLKSMAKEAFANRSRLRLLMFAGVLVPLLAAGAFGYWAFHKPMDPNALFEFAKKSIVELELLRDEREIEELKSLAGLTDADFRESVGFCTGSIVAPDVVLTAFHCLRGPTSFEINTKFRVKTSDGKLHETVRVLGFDVKRDFTFLEVPGLSSYGALAFASSYEVGQPVYTIGNVGGEGVAIRDGIMASTTTDPDDPTIEYVRYSAAASPGNSGGPLVDGYGRIVGLVFAGTYSENYNLATGSEHLLAGRKKFVDDREPKSVPIASKSILNFNSMEMLSRLVFPVDYGWWDSPELLQPLDKLEVAVDVPAAPEDLAAQLLERYHAASATAFREVAREFAERGAPIAQWSAQLEPGMVVNPYAVVLGRSGLSSPRTGLLLPRETNVVRPAPSYSWKRYRKELENEEMGTYPAEYVSASSFDEKTRATFAVYLSMSPEEKRQVAVLSRFVLARHALEKPASWDDARRIEAADLEPHLLGKEGLLSDTSFNPFVRPSSHKAFTLTRFEAPPERADVQDARGRAWTRFSWKIGSAALDVYCRPTPQGSVCLAGVHDQSAGKIGDLIRQGYVAGTLSESLLEPAFWDVDALLDYYAKGLTKGEPLFSDFDLARAPDGSLRVTVPSLGLVYRFPREKAPDLLRLVGGLRRVESGVTGIGLAIEGYSSKRNEVCGTEHEVAGSFASLFRRMDGERAGKSLLPRSASKLRSRRLGVDLMVNDYCATVYRQRGQAFVEYGITKPFAIEREVLP